MPDPFIFDTTSPRFALPMLFSGQAQKELWVNEAHALTDALLHCLVEGEQTDPPTTPVEGENWIAATGATGDWAGHDGEIACRQGGNWLFVAPQDGLRVLDRSTGQERLFLGGWNIPGAPADPSGGSTIDIEARAVLSNLIAALRVSGVFPTV
ncbi:MAG: DUF2793 domain-containing protein [Sphingomonadaceae bacterium]|nr:DUF2793 domain-containing protein [Sphingomonadaceae bacterium]